MGQIDQLLRRVAGAPVRTVLLWRSRGISWKVITSNLLPEPSLSIIHHQLLPSRAGNGLNRQKWRMEEFQNLRLHRHQKGTIWPKHSSLMKKHPEAWCRLMWSPFYVCLQPAHPDYEQLSCIQSIKLPLASISTWYVFLVDVSFQSKCISGSSYVVLQYN